MKSHADDEKLPRLLDANLRQVRLKQVFAWWKDWTGKIKTLKSWKEDKAIAKDKILKQVYMNKMKETFQKCQNMNVSKKKLELEIKRKFITCWVNQINSRRSLT